jgi:hypothetical protein
VGRSHLLERELTRPRSERERERQRQRQRQRERERDRERERETCQCTVTAAALQSKGLKKNTESILLKRKFQMADSSPCSLQRSRTQIKPYDIRVSCGQRRSK